MKAGDLVCHISDGDLGLVLNIDADDDFPYLVWWFSGEDLGHLWMTGTALEVISESR